jgi:hypothetical protein
MQISIVDVGAPTTHASSNGRSYQIIEVAYKNDSGQLQQKKLMSFRNPDVFKTAQTWQKGDMVHVQAEKNDKGYWEWIGLGEEAAAKSPTPQSQSKPSTPTRVTGSNYETKEERAARQVMIVRQSSISSAVSALTAGNTVPKVDQIILMAKAFEDYVMDNGVAIVDKADGGVDNFEDDVPF